MTSATLRTEGTKPVVTLVRELVDPPETVWLALTEPDRLQAWFPCGIVTDGWRVGAELTFPFPDDVGMTLSGVVLELDRPRLLAYTWGDETLRFELSPLPSGGTRLVLSDELPASFAARNAAGWEVCLDRLTGLVPPEDAWTPLFDHYAASFEPALGPQDGPPV
ncbi:MAG TPA: SRPBCC domain-containing protein [Acidimicrobiales bacterium]|jgi:uncharacterized protein YndB with AHSA1/START domain